MVTAQDNGYKWIMVDLISILDVNFCFYFDDNISDLTTKDTERNKMAYLSEYHGKLSHLNGVLCAILDLMPLISHKIIK